MPHRLENLPVLFDRRIPQEAQALAGAGWRVTVVCPKSAMHPQDEEVIDGILVYRHPAPWEARGPVWLRLRNMRAPFITKSRLPWRVFRRHGIDVIQACNPPDLIFLVAIPFMLLGARLRHTISTTSARSSILQTFRRRGIGYWATRLCEWPSYRSADLVITANDSFKVLCSSRNRKRLSDVIAIRSFPDTANFSLATPERKLAVHSRLALGYVGVIGDQDGLESLVRAVALLRARTASPISCAELLVMDRDGSYDGRFERKGRFAVASPNFAARR